MFIGSASERQAKRSIGSEQTNNEGAMIIHKYKPGDKLVHVFLGEVEYTETCFALDALGDCYDGIHVLHDGDEKEVSLCLVSRL